MAMLLHRMSQLARRSALGDEECWAGEPVYDPSSPLCLGWWEVGSCLFSHPRSHVTGRNTVLCCYAGKAAAFLVGVTGLNKTGSEKRRL